MLCSTGEFNDRLYIIALSSHLSYLVHSVDKLPDSPFRPKYRLWTKPTEKFDVSPKTEFHEIHTDLVKQFLSVDVYYRYFSQQPVCESVESNVGLNKEYSYLQTGCRQHLGYKFTCERVKLEITRFCLFAFMT